MKPKRYFVIILSLGHAAFALAQPVPQTPAVPVTADNYNRAQTEVYFGQTVKAGALGKFRHGRELAPIVNRGIVRPNRDTLYSFAVFDFDAGPVTVTLPDAAKRFMVMRSENHTHPPPMARVKSRSASIAIRVPNGATGLHRVKAKVEKT